MLGVPKVAAMDMWTFANVWLDFSLPVWVCWVRVVDYRNARMCG